MSYHNPHLIPKVRSEALMQRIGGKVGGIQQFEPYGCNLRIASFLPGYRCASDSTVVGVHLEAPIRGLSMPGKGAATKITDLGVVAGCLHCHNLIAGVDPRIEYIIEKYPAALMHRLLCGLIETHALLVRDGIIVVKGMEVI